MSELICKDKVGVFVGVSLTISSDRASIKVFVTMNDGNFCIDTQELTFKIININDRECLRNIIEIEERESVEGVGRFSVSVDGLITIPEPLVCDHEFQPETDEPTHGVKMLINYLRSIGNYYQDEKFFYRICRKCDRLEHLNKSANTLVSESLNQDFELEIMRYDDTNYRMLCMVLKHVNKAVKNFLLEYTTRNNMKIIAGGFPASTFKYPELLMAIQHEFWIDLDAFPCFFLTTRLDIESIADSFSRKSARLMGFNNLLRLEISKHNVVEIDSSVISFCSLQSYRDFLENPLLRVVDDLQVIAKRFAGKRISFISSTPQGGGVALMRHAHMRFYKLLGMDVSWYVTIPVASVYTITKKKFHNVLQNVARNEQLCAEDKKIYESWIKINCDRLWSNSVFKESDIVVLDDHQTCGFYKFVRSANPKAKVIYRSHIQIRGELYKTKEEFTTTWNYIFSNIRGVDLFISHPIESFVPLNVDRRKIVYQPPSTDPLDGLNKPMNEYISDYYECLFHKSSGECQQKELSLHKPYIVQISRFDPSKGQKDAIDVFSIVYKQLESRIKTVGDPLYDLHLVLCGHGSVDDPEGGLIFNELMAYLDEEKNAAVKNNIIVVKLPPLDQILNLVLKKARVALQLSISEGFEIKVTEAILKSVPVVVYDSGGLPLQVYEDKTGFIVPCGDTAAAAEKTTYLLEHPEFATNMCGYIHLSYIHTTPFQILGWTRIFEKVLKNEDGNEEIILESIVKEYFDPFKDFMLPKLLR
ncbi:Glycosyltransferase [Trachipleistophora hominis]|uniref:Glycosyltransferase n=1 Tax=Trachipleistophora hominis TaxID=72359 RepID=L7JX12_TRAHO|nr:Glycosyltransferase [Trachipleistophora hominis]